MPDTALYDLPYPAAVGVAPDVPYWTQQLAEAVEAVIAARTTHQHVHVTRATVQNIPAAAWTSIAFSGTVGAATAGMWAAGTPARLVAPVAGLYDVKAVVGWTVPGAESQFIRWNVGGTFYRGGGAYGINNECSLADTFRLAAGAWIEVQAYSTGARSTQALEGMPRATMTRIGP